MGRQSTIKKLPPTIREELDRLIADGWTIVDLTEHLKGLGHPVSESAVGRHKKKFTDFARQIEEMRAVAAPLLAQLGADETDDVGRALVETLHTVLFQVLTQARTGAGNVALDPADMMMLGRAMKDLAQAKKISTDRELAIRKDTAAKAAAVAGDAVKAAGLGKATVDDIKKRILGVV